MKDITARLKAARERQGRHYFNGFINAYCDNGNCTGRGFHIQIKTYGAKDPVSVYCPLCGKVAIPDRYHEPVETLAEYVTRNSYEARCSVNVQRYVKKKGPWVPATVAFDDSLPE